MEQRSAARVRAWLETLPRETRSRLFLLLDELCTGLGVSRHNEFGFLRLRVEFETSGEPEHLRPKVESEGHPVFR